MIKSDLIVIRDARPEDLNLIYATFLRSLYFGESWFTIIPKNIFMEHYHKVIDYIIKKPTTTIKIACQKEDHNEIVGYSLYEGDKLHFVFVKKIWRSIGIAKDLVPTDIKVVTHLNKVGLSIIRNRPIDFNPFDV